MAPPSSRQWYHKPEPQTKTNKGLNPAQNHQSRYKSVPPPPATSASNIRDVPPQLLGNTNKVRYTILRADLTDLEGPPHGGLSRATATRLSQPKLANLVTNPRLHNPQLPHATANPSQAQPFIGEGTHNKRSLAGAGVLGQTKCCPCRVQSSLVNRFILGHFRSSRKFGSPDARARMC